MSGPEEVHPTPEGKEQKEDSTSPWVPVTDVHVEESVADSEGLVAFLLRKERPLEARLKHQTPSTRSVSLPNLYAIVKENGGVEQVTNQKLWASLWRDVMPGDSRPDGDGLLKSLYTEYLSDFPPKEGLLPSPPQEATDDKNVSKESVSRPVLDEEHSEVCAVCGFPGEVVLCDGCPASYHLLCLSPPVHCAEELPEGDWFCPTCTKAALEKCKATKNGPRRKRTRRVAIDLEKDTEDVQ